MKKADICYKINKIQSALQDEQSKILFDARLNYSITKNNRLFYEAVDSFENKWYCPELEQFLSRTNGKEIILWGWGYHGRETKRVLDLCHCTIHYLCDRDEHKIGTKIEGISVISPEEVFENHRDSSVIIGSERYKDQMRQELLLHNFPERNILYPCYDHLQAQTDKKQYFDVFGPVENEVFIDAGAYDGNTILDFVNWSEEKYQKIIAMEPLREMKEKIDSMCKKNNLERIVIEEAAAWDKEEELFFTEDRAGSRVETKGNLCIQGKTIDSLSIKDKVTFIKMDVEGSELKALEGAKQTIQRDCPRLAVSLYHKPEDIIELPYYILELVPDYKFYIRHYTSNWNETVLYAVFHSSQNKAE